MIGKKSGTVRLMKCSISGFKNKFKKMGAPDSMTG